MFICFDIEKFLDGHGFKTNDIGPSIVTQHVQQLQSNYFWTYTYGSQKVVFETTFPHLFSFFQVSP